MPRRLNYTNRKRINRDDVSIRLHRNGHGLAFDAKLRLADYKLDTISPPPHVYVEAYRGASALWKRFDFGRYGTDKAPDDCSLDEFGVPEGILFRVKVSAAGDDALGRLLADADAIRPRLPDEQDAHGQPLIESMPSNAIGDEPWRLDFSDQMPRLLINDRVPMGWQEFARDPRHRCLFAPAVMRQILTRILIVEQDIGEEDNPDDWRQRWLRFAARVTGSTEPMEVYDPADANLQRVEEAIDDAVEAFTARAGLFTAAFAEPVVQEGQS